MGESEPLTPAIEFRNVHFSFDDQKVFDDISFIVQKSEIKIILSGSGGGNQILWLVPLLMLGVILLGLMRVWKKMPTVFALVSMASGLISAYLLDRERRDAEGLTVTRLMGWFWLGLFSSLVVVISALVFYLKRSKPT